MRAEEKLKEVLKRAGYRVTRQRLVIFEALRGTTSHPTAEEIYNMVKSRLPNISLGTVYRTLELFERLGVLQRLTFEGSPSRFDGNPKPHYHAICLGCGRVLDADEPVPEDIGRRFSEETGFEIVGYKLEFYGYCKECASKRRENENKG
ncbi:transcriptional repressor [Candidatus Poribacteria bacterium]|nr:MAG: transcriptional repressor [Candidatus Poribacteria bacterium]